MKGVSGLSRFYCIGFSLFVGSSTVAGEISRQPAEVPRHYDAPLPSSAAGMLAWSNGDPSFPPIGHVLDEIKRGNGAWMQRWRQAAAGVPVDELSSWAQQWQQSLRFMTITSGFCDFSRDAMRGADVALKAAVSRSFASDCATAADAKLLQADDVPAIALVAFYAAQAESGLPPVFVPRLEQAVQSIVNDSEGYRQRFAAFTLAELKQPAATQALLRIHRQVNDQRVADQVAMAFFYTDDAEALQRAGEACQRQARDPMCSRVQYDYADAEQPSVADRQSVEAAIAALTSAGFERVSKLDVARQASADAQWLLAEAGYVHGFDVETGMFPNQHDSLLRDLAALVTPALDDAIFEEIYSPDDSGPYRLRAYVDGALYQCEAANYGDWYDVEAVLALLNRLADDRGLDQRFVTLHSEDQTALVVAAPAGALQRAFAQHLLVAGQAQQAMESGKAFEAEVLRDLQR